MEEFLDSVEQERFKKDTENLLRYSNLSIEELRAIRSLADDRNIVMKEVDSGSAVVVWDRDDYVKEAKKKLDDENVYRKVNYNEKLQSELVDKSNYFFKELERYVFRIKL